MVTRLKMNLAIKHDTFVFNQQSWSSTMPRRVLWICVLAFTVACGDDDPDKDTNSEPPPDDKGVVDDSGVQEDAPLPCDDPKTYYRDEDGDSFGDPFDSVEACSQPAGFVTNKLDCADGDANAHPQQDQFFDVEIQGDAANKWDYNCDGIAEPAIVHDAIICANRGYTICETNFQPSWHGTAPPACGEEGEIVVSCTVNGGALDFTCDANISGKEQQTCR
jgi:hypothetical protein